jgi:hypothetical protein
MPKGLAQTFEDRSTSCFMAYVAPLFYPPADIRWAILQPDSSSYAGGKKPYRFTIHQLYFSQVKRHFGRFCFRGEELMQLRHMSLLDSAAESEDRVSLIFGSANL